VGEEADAALVLGYGTAKGGVMPIRQVPPDQLPPSEEDARPLIPDPRTGKPARSRLDETTLRDIATELGGTYVHSDGEADMRELAAEVTRAAYADLEPVDPDRELRWMWALALLALGLVELALGYRRFVVAGRELQP
jgi:Ca-activated chloride channel family protein